MRAADADKLDAQCVLALIMAAIRADRFSEGALLTFFEDCTILRWLKRLRDIDWRRTKKRPECLVFEIGGFGGWETHTLVFHDDTAVLSDGELPQEAITVREYDTDQTAELIDSWNAVHSEYWKFDYPQIGELRVCDGTQWTLYVQYDGLRAKVYSGDNNYPVNWNLVLEIFGVDNGEIEEDDDDTDADDDDKPTRQDNVIVLHPDFEKLKAEVEKLRTELSMLVLERDDLIYQECKNIEMAYMLSVGSLEYKAYEIECAILRLKRKVELIQAKKNRQEKIILPYIESILDSEFAEYQSKLNEQVEQMNTALERSKGKMLNEAESRELKKLYRVIVKSLHPDMNPDLPDAKIQLFMNAISAYECGDLNGLRIISEMVSESVLPDLKSNGLVVLMKEKDRLLILLQSIKDKIAEIKSEYPYTMKPLIQSPAAVEARKAELEESIGKLNETLVAYKTRIDDMLR
jgi:hypothetical protein